MTRRTYEADAEHIETADDLDDFVQDKREGWRASSSKARRRQRRYKKRLTNELLRMDHLDEDWKTPTWYLIYASVLKLIDYTCSPNG